MSAPQYSELEPYLYDECKSTDGIILVGDGTRRGRMEPTSTGHKPSVLIPRQVAVAEIHGFWGWSTPHLISQLHSCKAFSLSALPTADTVINQRLLVLTSFEPLSWASGNNIHLGVLLPLVRHRLRIYPNVATAFCLSPAAWHRDGN